MSKLNINAREFKPATNGKKKPKNIFKVSYHPDNKDSKDINTIEGSSVVFSNENASTCFDAQSSNQSNLLLTVRNSTKSINTFDLEKEETFMQIDFQKSQHSD